MTITIEGIQYQLPVSLMNITLGDRIEFDSQYGKDLRDRLKKIAEMKDGFEREMDNTEYQLDMACKTLSFFAKIPLDIVQNTRMDDVLLMYHNTLKNFSEDISFAEADFTLNNEFEWNGETWVMIAPELKQDSSATFGEFLDAKQAVKDLWELGNEKWSAMLKLACVYFRKKGEKYHESLAYEGSDRYELMKTLPFEYAIHVGFFLNASITGYAKIFHSSILQEMLQDQN